MHLTRSAHHTEEFLQCTDIWDEIGVEDATLEARQENIRILFLVDRASRITQI
jgi:hypothetical protein